MQQLNFGSKAQPN